MRKQLIASLSFTLVCLASGCASMDETLPRATASTMTQTSSPHAGDDHGRGRTTTRAPEERRGLSGIFRRRSATTPAPSPSYRSPQSSTLDMTPAPQRSRGQRALDVLRRSPLGRAGRVVTGRGTPAPSTEASVSSSENTSGSVSVQPTSRVVVGQPVETGSSIRSTVTGHPVDQVPGTTSMGLINASTNAPIVTSTPGGTSVPQQTLEPGAGRVYVGQPVDTGSGIKSSVTGTPVEPIPGVTPASTNLQSTTNSSNATSATAGTNTLPSSPAPAPLNAGTPPVSQIAPGEPAPGTKVSNTKASTTPVEVEIGPDGNPVITNEEEEPAAKTTAKPKKKTNG